MSYFLLIYVVLLVYSLQIASFLKIPSLNEEVSNSYSRKVCYCSLFFLALLHLLLNYTKTGNKFCCSYGHVWQN